MLDLSTVGEHMEVIGSDGAHVGTVDHVEGDSLKLTKSDPDAHGEHHRIPASLVDHVDEHVHLNVSAADAKAHWQSAEFPAGTASE